MMKNSMYIFRKRPLSSSQVSEGLQRMTFGKLIDVEDTRNDCKFLMYPPEPWTDHKSSLDYMKGV